MKPNTKVSPSSQVDTILPRYVVENYNEFVSFMETAAQSEERLGFGQDILQNLQKYRNLDTYKSKITQYGILAERIEEDTEELTLVDGFGFPEENGVILIHDEVILYKERDGNTLYGLQRGAAGTTVLPTFRTSGTYVKTVAAQHNGESRVENLSVLFLVAMLENIHESFAPNVAASRVDANVNHSNLIQNIRDFFSSKGSKLGIKALFRMLFGAEDVRVSYPGERMIIPSDSTWAVNTIIRVIPWGKYISDPTEPYTTPDKLIGSELLLKRFPSGEIIGRTQCEYVTTYPLGGETQYEIYTNADTSFGDFLINNTQLSRPLETEGVNNNEFDVYTATVDSTFGFPSSGVFFVGSEGIKYESKSQTQFLNLTRGYVSVVTEHNIGDDVFGAYYLEGKYTDSEGTTYYSRSWPTGLISGVSIDDPGLLNQTDDNIILKSAGLVDYRDVSLDTFQVNSTFALASQGAPPPSIPYLANRTYGVSGVYFNEEQLFVVSSDLPSTKVGPFSTDDSVGPDMIVPSDIHAIPRRVSIKDNLPGAEKGVGTIGVAVDGVPFYSNISPDSHIEGEITSITVEDGGKSYLNPQVIFEPAGAEATATVTDGVITDITITTNANYTEVPVVRVTGGEGGAISLTLDNYGRILDATITNAGQYYNDAPKISIVDGQGRGRGAFVTCTVSGGSLETVTVEVAGIDYSAVTAAQVIPVGAGAVLSATVQTWQYDRKVQVDTLPNADFDSNDGFLYEDEGVVSRYGYIKRPHKLMQELGDDASKHSPIIGWAWDGNPIYGPYAYVNNVDASGGIEKQQSGYVLETDRTTIVPYTSTTVATSPPSTATYPMGTFIQDWTYDPARLLNLDGIILQEDSDDVHQDGAPNDGDDIEYDAVHDITSNAILDRLNGKICNTPDFPKELYPDGVYCYFLTTYGDLEKFPYIIGATFKYLPSTQKITVYDQGSTYQVDNVGGTYTTDTASVDFSKVDLNRTGDLTTIDNSIAIDIAHVTEGSVSSVRIEDGSPDTNVVGDMLLFNNTGTDGAGAEAQISHIWGKTVTSGTNVPIETPVFSHRQLINLDYNEESYVLSEGLNIPTFKGASFEVVSYDADARLLTVDTKSRELVQFEDEFRDARGTLITLPPSRLGTQELSSYVVGGTNTFMSYSQPESDTASPGDLWWSGQNNRLYVFYKDADSSQWVTTQPIGTRPWEGAGDIGTGDTSATGGQVYSSPQADNRVTISTQAPGARADGSPNQRGDLWWSTHTGNLYIWNSDRITPYYQEAQEWSSEWVVTDPAAVISDEEPSAYSEFNVVSGDTTVYEQQARVLISEIGPTAMADGSALEAGTLWWSPLTGKMYIYYIDSDSSQWVVTNPSGMQSGEGSLERVIPGTGSSRPDVITILPEPATTTTFHVENTQHFFAGDIVRLQSGAPDVEGVNEDVTIQAIGLNSITVTRSDSPIQVANGAVIRNLTRDLYTIVTETPHGLVEGDMIRIYGSEQEGFNGSNCEVVIGGVVQSAVGTATISGGEVTAVSVVSGGFGYPEDVQVTFTGGDGIGAYGIAHNNNQGQITDVTITEGGHNYTTAPQVRFNSRTSEYEFSFYVYDEYTDEDTIRYSSTSLSAEGEVAEVTLTSGGYGYLKLPTITGIYKRSSDRAKTTIVLEGSTIGSVVVSDGGRRYVDPVAVFEDTTGNGSGATADVGAIAGKVVSVTVTNPGSGYTEPILNIVERDGKYIALTDSIGALKSFHVTRPGRTVPNDNTLNPEVELTTRLIITPTAASIGQFLPDQVVYQGTDEYRVATARVFTYDDERQLLALNTVEGEFKEGEIVYNEEGTEAEVLVSGQATARLEVGSIAPSVGRFIDDESKLSAKYAVMQDSNEFQWFSYNIASPMQQVQYETFVRDLVHPTGFALFSDVLVSDQVTSPFNVIDVDITLDN